MTQLSIFDRPSPFQLLFEELAREDKGDGLRYYQTECRSRVERALEAHRSTLVVMATGLGKTVVFVSLAKLWPGSVLVLAHRDELVEQARAKLVEMTGEYVGTEKAEEVSSPKTRLVVGSVQSFNKKRMERLGRDRFSLIVVDEAHHAVARSYKRIFEFFSAKVLGVTATPDRGDEKALGQVFDDVAFVMDIWDGIETGFLVPPVDCKRIVLEGIDLDAVKKSGKDLDEAELDVQMAANVEAIVKETLRRAPDKAAICFFPGVRSAELAAMKFNELLPGSAAFVSSHTHPDERAGIMAAFKQRRLRYLCNCQIATEGFDAPGTSLIVMARPTLSRALYAQMIGRATRVLAGIVDRFPGKGMARERREAIAKSLKPSFQILDFVGNSQKHDLVTVVDVLGGKYSEAEVKEAKKRVAGGQNAIEALTEARRRLQELAKKTTVQVTATAHAFDPFSVLGLSIQEQDRYSNVGKFGAKPAHPGQVAKLAAMGLPQDSLNQLSFRGAKRLIDKCLARRAAGFCTYKQLATLRKFGVTLADVAFDRATAALDYIAAKKGWANNPYGQTKVGHVDPKVLDDIVNYRRASGED